MAKPDDEAPDAPAKRGRGRPTKYQKTYEKQVYKLALLGLTDVEIAGVFDVSERTLNTWKREHPEFSAAQRRGRVLADAEVAASLYERALGYSHPEVVITTHKGMITQTRVTKHYPPDTAAATKWLFNRQPGRWRAVPEPMGDDEVPTPVRIEVRVEDGRRDQSAAEPPAS